MQAYKLAVIVLFSIEFRRDAASLYDAIVERLPRALGKKFDATVFGGVEAPGADFDTFADCTAQDISANAYAGLVKADSGVSTNGGIMNGVVLAPQGKGNLLRSTDENGRPLFINSVAEGSIPIFLESRTLFRRALM